VNCPRCQQSLGPIQHRGVRLDGCKGCRGTLVPIPSLTPLLEATSVDLLASFDPDTALEAVAVSGDDIGCPKCGRAMELADYCGARLVSFDRCNRCSVLWVGPEELGTMTLMWARMEKRAARLKAASDEFAAELDALGRRAGRKAAIARVVGLALFSL
jgi:Zn-finger nucleic acid-binding protein